MTLAGKTVLITGGAKRIGRAIALAFAEKNTKILIHFHQSQQEAHALVENLGARGIFAKAYPADLSQMKEIQDLQETILSEIGGVDILIHNASVFFPTPAAHITERDWSSLMDVNLKAPFFLSQGFIPSMRQRKWGRIISIADWTALRPMTRYIPYCISKAGLITMTQGLARELAPEILVNAICPGPVLPPPQMREEAKKKIASQTLVGHWGDPKEIARMALFLAESNFITGQAYLLEGGESLK